MPYSSFTSKWHPVLCELGYPELDVRFVRENGQETGEWCIYEMLNPPTIPALCQWRDVLSGLKNIEINRSNLKNFAESIDIKKQAIWERELKKSKAVEDEHEQVQKRRLETIDRIAESYTRNEALMNRIARNGLWEMDPRAILRHIPRHRF